MPLVIAAAYAQDHAPLQEHPPLELTASAAQVAPGETLTLEVRAGSEETPAENLFGLSFKLGYASAAFSIGSAEAGALMRKGLPPEATLIIFDNMLGQQPAPFSITRVRPQPGVSGHGAVARFEVAVAADAAGGTYAFTLEDVEGTDPDGGTVAFSAQEGTVEVEAANRAPVAQDDKAAAEHGGAVDIDVLANDSDPDAGQTLSISAVTSAPQSGTAAIKGSGTPEDPSDDVITYAPNAGFTGLDSFEYQVSDGAGGTDVATVEVAVYESAATWTTTSTITVLFLGTSDEGLTWNYLVIEDEGSQDLSHWVLDLCGDPTIEPDASDPNIEELKTGFDPTTGVTGAKWNTESDFDGDGDVAQDARLFSATYSEAYKATTVELGTKTGFGSVTGTITGPDCAGACTAERAPQMEGSITTYGEAAGAGWASAALTFPNGFANAALGAPTVNTELAGTFEASSFSFEASDPLSSGELAEPGEEEVLLLLRAPERRVSTFFAEFEDQEGCAGRIDPQADFYGQPGALVLGPNHPNPFRGATSIAFELPEATQVRLVVYDLVGREVATLVDHQLPAGRHAASWDGRSAAGTKMPSGLYVYRLETGGAARAQRMLLVK